MDSKLEDTSVHQRYYLRKVLNTIFPSEYIHHRHKPPQSVCSVFNFRTTTNDVSGAIEESYDVERLLGEKAKRLPYLHTSRHDDRCVERLEASMEPISRIEISCLRNRFEASLTQHQAKSFGLCPIRRTIFDQLFGKCMFVTR